MIAQYFVPTPFWDTVLILLKLSSSILYWFKVQNQDKKRKDII